MIDEWTEYVLWVKREAEKLVPRTSHPAKPRLKLEVTSPKTQIPFFSQGTRRK